MRRLAGIVLLALAVLGLRSVTSADYGNPVSPCTSGMYGEYYYNQQITLSAPEYFVAPCIADHGLAGNPVWTAPGGQPPPTFGHPSPYSAGVMPGETMILGGENLTTSEFKSAGVWAVVYQNLTAKPVLLGTYSFGANLFVGWLPNTNPLDEQQLVSALLKVLQGSEMAILYVQITANSQRLAQAVHYVPPFDPPHSVLYTADVIRRNFDCKIPRVMPFDQPPHC